MYLATFVDLDRLLDFDLAREVDKNLLQFAPLFALVLQPLKVVRRQFRKSTLLLQSDISIGYEFLAQDRP